MVYDLSIVFRVKNVFYSRQAKRVQQKALKNPHEATTST